ncbi:hypothetical protein CY34DRAFT_642934 [Suillus luteus UH-Slu-Lm8-n1]|uniref:Uncharacterized protein n=1 Tax=Suillus luteus UH-Slu-Lm8-n1 TaxID=930992 RepID=A0A0C9ZAE3_9AGAM|nr:hypothetical protein CY34DRAFT_642934 [Suillus luteus UH-Slu-Lm8-n1]
MQVHHDDGPWSIRSIEGAVTPRACTARPKGVHNFSIYASLQREQPKIALEISRRHRQRLTLSWFSSSRMHYTESRVSRRGQMSVSIIPFWRHRRWTVVYLARTH